MKSIRQFLITVLFSVIAVILFLAMVVGYQRSLQQAELLFDQELAEKYGLIRYFLEAESTRAASGMFWPEDADPVREHNFLFQVVNHQQDMVFQSGDFGERLLVPLIEGSVDFNYDDRRWHGLLHQTPDARHWVLVAEQDDLRYRLADAIVVDLLQPILLGLFAVAFFIWWVVRSGFQPVKQVSLSIYQKSISDLSPLQTEQIPQELKEIAVSVNDLFDRITASYEREKRFTADAAHEMRNPITALKIHIDNLMEETPEKKEAHFKIKQAIDRLSNLVEQLLVLHRMSPEQYAAHFVDVDFHALATEAIQEAYPFFEQKDQSVELQGEHITCQADPFGVEVLIKNLLDNAIKYTPHGGRIILSVLRDGGGGALIQLDDSGPGIAAHERQRVMDRFYRVGGDRHESKVIGSGLGMSIVKHIADLHGASLVLGQSSLGGLCVKVLFGASTIQEPGA